VAGVTQDPRAGVYAGPRRQREGLLIDLGLLVGTKNAMWRRIKCALPASLEWARGRTVNWQEGRGCGGWGYGTR